MNDPSGEGKEKDVVCVILFVGGMGGKVGPRTLFTMHVLDGIKWGYLQDERPQKPGTARIKYSA